VSTTEYTLRYASTRSEIWHWYWREWTRLRGLWRFHALIALAGGFVVAGRGNSSQFSPERFAIAAVTTLTASIVLLSLWPQLRFKPQPRVLILDAAGFRTTIGTQSGQRRWQDIRRVEDHGDGSILLVGQNGNAMILPRRAFASDAERQNCLKSIEHWQQAARDSDVTAN
jgi:hypothetical protein